MESQASINLFCWERNLDFIWKEEKINRRWRKKTRVLCVLKCHFCDLRFSFSFSWDIFYRCNFFLPALSLLFRNAFFVLCIDDQRYLKLILNRNRFFVESDWMKNCRKNPSRIRNRPYLSSQPFTTAREANLWFLKGFLEATGVMLRVEMQEEGNERKFWKLLNFNLEENAKKFWRFEKVLESFS